MILSSMGTIAKQATYFLFKQLFARQSSHLPRAEKVGVVSRLSAMLLRLDNYPK